MPTLLAGRHSSNATSHVTMDSLPTGGAGSLAGCQLSARGLIGAIQADLGDYYETVKPERLPDALS